MAAGEIVVPFSDDQSETVTDDQLIVEADKPGDSPEVKAERAQRRRERAKEREQERKEQAERLTRVEAELAQERAERARLQGFVQALPAAQPQPGKDPYEAALDAVYERRSNAYAAMQAELKAGTLDEKRSKHFERESRDIEGEIARIHAERAVNSRVPQQRQEQAQQQWVSKYPEVYNSPVAFEYARGRFQSRQALARANGETLSNDVVDEIMQETQTTFKLGKKAPPSRTERDRLSGTSSGSSGSSGGDGGGHGISMTKELRSMAVARYGGPGISDEQAIKQWVQREGKELRKQKVL